MKKIVVIAAFCTHVVNAGFSGNTTLKIIPNFLQKFDMYKNEIRKSSQFATLYAQQFKQKNRIDLSVQTWEIPPFSYSYKHFKNDPTPKEIRINSINDNSVIGINFSSKSRKSVIDFDIICSKKQLFSTPYDIITYKQAQDLCTNDSIICVSRSCIEAKKIYEIKTIYNKNNQLYKIFAAQRCMILVGRYGAIASVEPKVVQEN